MLWIFNGIKRTTNENPPQSTNEGITAFDKNHIQNYTHKLPQNT